MEAVEGGGSAGPGWLWVTPLLLAAFLLLSFPFEVSLHQRLRGQSAFSLVELARPGDYVDADKMRALECASRESMVAAARVMTGPENLLGLEPLEKMGVRTHLDRFSRLADGALYLQVRFMEVLGDAALERHRGAMDEDLRGLKGANATWEAVWGALDSEYPGLLLRAQGQRLPIPEGWEPIDDPAAFSRWLPTLGDGSRNYPADPFMSHQVRALALYQLSADETMEDGKAMAFAASLLALQEHSEALMQEWVLLYRIAVGRNPDRAALVPLGPLGFDLPLHQMAEGLRLLARRDGP